MASSRSTLTRKGQATIPIELREKLGLQPLAPELLDQIAGGQIEALCLLQMHESRLGGLPRSGDGNVPRPKLISGPNLEQKARPVLHPASASDRS
jgi:hypothetical protein